MMTKRKDSKALTYAFVQKVLQPIVFLTEDECIEIANDLTKQITKRRQSGQSKLELALSMDEATLAMMAFLEGVSNVETKNAMGADACIDNVYAKNAKAREIILWACDPNITDRELCKLIGWEYEKQAREYRENLGMHQRDISCGPEAFELYAFFSDANPTMEEMMMLTGRPPKELEQFKDYEIVLKRNKAFDLVGAQLLDMMHNHCNLADDYITRHCAACMRNFVERYHNNTGLRRTTATNRIKDIMSISSSMAKDICSEGNAWRVRSYYIPSTGSWETFVPEFFDPSLAEEHMSFYELCCERLREEGFEVENWIQFCTALEAYCDEM